MNTNSEAIKILCYGDSNTWGQNPSEERYPSNVRWTGVLQNLLGEDYEIIEEGLGGRTTIFDRPEKPGRNGKIYFLPCIKTHNPIDIVILALGTNDFKLGDIKAEDVAKGNEELMKIIQEYGWNKDKKIPKIILVCVPNIDESNQYIIEKGMVGAEEKIKHLPSEMEKLAKKYNSGYLNLQEIVEPSKKDGCHLEPEAHKKIAKALFDKIKEIKLN